MTVKTPILAAFQAKVILTSRCENPVIPDPGNTTMYRNFPVLESERAVISAQRYNRVRLSLSWLDNPIRLELTGMHDLELILTGNAWLCIDTGLGNLPVLAWKDFRTGQRRSLHEPVSCRIDYYNLHAELIKDRVLEIMDRLLAARLQRRLQGRRGQVYRLGSKGRRLSH